MRIIRVIILLLSYFSLVLSIRQELYLDGISLDDVFPFLNNHYLNIDDPRGILVEDLLETNKKVTDIQFTSDHFVFVLAEDELYLLGFNFAPSYVSYTSVVNPFVKRIATHVSHIRTKSLDLNGQTAFLFDYDDRSRENLCHGVVDEHVNLKTELDFHCVTVLNGIKDLAIVDTSQCYLLDDHSDLYHVHYGGANVEMTIEWSDIEMIAFPAAISRVHGLLYIGEKDPIVYKGLKPVYITSYNQFEDDKSFVAVFENGEIQGFGFDHWHPMFKNSCSIIHSTSCKVRHHVYNLQSIDYTSKYGTVLDDDELYIYLLNPVEDDHGNDNRNSTPHVITWSIPIDKFALLNHWRDPVIIVMDEKAYVQQGPLYYDNVLYSLKPVENSFQHLYSVRNMIRKTDFVGKTRYTLLKNGRFEVDDSLIATQVIDFIVNEYSMTFAERHKVYTDHHVLPMAGAIQKLGQGHLGYNQFYVYKDNGSLELYTTDNNEVQLILEEAFEDAYFDSATTVLRRGENLYCGPYEQFCCDINLKARPIVIEDIYKNRLHLYPIELYGLEGFASSIKDIKMTNTHKIFLTNQGDVYICGDYPKPEDTISKVKENPQERYNPIGDKAPLHRIRDDKINGNVCSIFTSGYSIYFQLCDTYKVYAYGHRPNRNVRLDSKGHVEEIQLSNDFIQLVDGIPNNKVLKDVSGFGVGALFLFEDLICNPEICTMEKILADGENAIIPNSNTVMVTGPSHIINSSITLQYGTYVILEDWMTLSQGHLKVEFSSREQFFNIYDGQRVNIIETNGLGYIQGNFTSVYVHIDAAMHDKCRGVTSRLEQNAYYVTIVFQIEEACYKMPIWVILIIVKSVLILMAMIIHIAMKKRQQLDEKSKKVVPD